MTYGISINLPNGLTVNENSVPFALADVFTLTTSTPNGSKTYTGFEGRTVRLYIVVNSVSFLNGSYYVQIPYYHTMTVTNSGIDGVAPSVAWANNPISGRVFSGSTVYVVMI